MELNCNALTISSIPRVVSIFPTAPRLFRLVFQGILESLRCVRWDDLEARGKRSIRRLEKRKRTASKVMIHLDFYLERYMENFVRVLVTNFLCLATSDVEPSGIGRASSFGCNSTALFVVKFRGERSPWSLRLTSVQREGNAGHHCGESHKVSWRHKFVTARTDETFGWFFI